MAFFTSASATILEKGTEGLSPEGKPVHIFKALNSASSPGVLVLLMVDSGTENASFMMKLSEMIAEQGPQRVLVTGVMQTVLAERDDKKVITKPSKTVIYVGAVRRLRADTKIDPEQYVVFGSGFSTPVTDYEDNTKRKAELMVSAGTESLQEAGKYASRLHLLGETAYQTDVLCTEAVEGQEIYFMGNLFRSAGEINGTQYDKIKVSCTFAQETDRVKKTSGGGGRRPKQASMRSQLDASFEDAESVTQTMSAEALTAQANCSLADF